MALSISLKSIFGNMLEQIIKQAICKHLEDNAIIARG